MLNMMLPRPTSGADSPITTHKVVRIAPNDISVNSVDGGIRSVYAGGYEKGNWYKNIFNNYGALLAW